MKHQKWTINSLQEEALKYSSRREFSLKHCGAYKTALRRGVLNDICGHMVQKADRKLKTTIKAKATIRWNVENLKLEALKYATRKDFEVGNKSAYYSALRRKLIDEICQHMEWNGGIDWTYDMLQAEAIKYQTRIDFQKGSKNAYHAAHRRKILDDICNHMQVHRINWTYDMLQAEAIKYQTRIDFQKGSDNAYQVSQKRKILDEICGHMECGNFGFNKNKSAILYYIKFESERNLPIYKIGITNVTTNDRIKSMGINKEYAATIIKEFYFEDGKECYDLEQEYHMEFNEHRYLGDDVLNSGKTELYYIDVLGLDSIKSLNIN